MGARAIAFGLALVACSSGPQQTSDAGADAAGDAGYVPRGTACAPSDAGAPVAWTAPPGAPPGAPPHPPLMRNYGGPVLASPILVPMTFDGDPYRDVIEDEVASIGCTSYWRSIVRDYGVGDAVMGAPVHMPDAPPHALSATQVEAFIRTKILSNAVPAPVPNRTLYVIAFPATTVLSANGGYNCTDFGGYHDALQLPDTTLVPFALVSECSTYGSLTGSDVVTRNLSHELMEAVSDPFGRTYTFPEATGGLAWQLGNLGGAEIGDLCQRDDAVILPSDYPFRVQPGWSSSAALGGLNPCQPASEPFYAAVPVLPDTLTFEWPGIGMPWSGPQTTPGIKLGFGGSKTVDLRLSSPSAWPDSIDIDVRDVNYPNPPNLTFDLPVSTGHVGDTLSLTIRRIGSGPSGFEPFAIRATSRGVTHVWWAVVGDP